MQNTVIGWTDYDDESFPAVEADGDVCAAVIYEMFLNGYYFSGDDHVFRRGCTPVLAGGRRAVFSSQSWDRLICGGLEANRSLRSSRPKIKYPSPLSEGERRGALPFADEGDKYCDKLELAWFKDILNGCLFGGAQSVRRERGEGVSADFGGYIIAGSSPFYPDGRPLRFQLYWDDGVEYCLSDCGDAFAGIPGVDAFSEEVTSAVRRYGCNVVKEEGRPFVYTLVNWDYEAAALSLASAVSFLAGRYGAK